MYTIKQAGQRSGISVPVLRAWERRYGVVRPTRTPAGYRLYDDAAVERLRAMRRLVDDGWSPRNAAAAVLSGNVPPAVAAAAAPAAAGDGLVGRFVAAAASLDAPAMERILDEMFALGTFEQVAERLVVPALEAIGESWAAGGMGVGAEHAASQAVHRRLAAAFQAAGRTGTDHPVLVGLPPGARHELGALAFSVVARRAGLEVLYLGADLPAPDWVATARRTDASAAVVGAVSPEDRPRAVEVARALLAADAALVVAFGGRSAPNPAVDLPDAPADRVLRLPDGLVEGVAALEGALRRPS